MKPGLSSYAFRWAFGTAGFTPPNPMTILNFIQEAAKVSASGVQICDNTGFENLKKDEAVAIRTAAEKAGLFIETGTRGLDPSYLGKSLFVSNLLGSRLMRLVVEIDRTKNRIEEEIAGIISSLRNLLARDVPNMVFSLENHSTLSSDELLTIMQTLNDPRLGICLDTMNSIQLIEDPAGMARKLSEFITCVHLKDFRIEKLPDEFKILGTAVGDGQVDFPAILRTLLPSPRIYSWHIELYIPRQDSPKATLEKEMEFVTRSIHAAQVLFSDVS